MKKWCVSFLTVHGNSRVYMYADTWAQVIEDAKRRYVNGQSFVAKECTNAS